MAVDENILIAKMENLKIFFTNTSKNAGSAPCKLSLQCQQKLDKKEAKQHIRDMSEYELHVTKKAPTHFSLQMSLLACSSRYIYYSLSCPVAVFQFQPTISEALSYVMAY